MLGQPLIKIMSGTCVVCKSKLYRDETSGQDLLGNQYSHCDGCGITVVVNNQATSL